MSRTQRSRRRYTAVTPATRGQQLLLDKTARRSQTALEALTGVRQQCLSRLCLGQQPSLAVANKLHVRLGIPPRAWGEPALVPTPKAKSAEREIVDRVRPAQPPKAA